MKYRLISRKRGWLIQQYSPVLIPHIPGNPPLKLERKEWHTLITYPRYLRFFAGIHLLWLRERARTKSL